MPYIFTCVILQINQSEEIGEMQLSVFCSRGDQISPLKHVALSVAVSNESGNHPTHSHLRSQLLCQLLEGFPKIGIIISVIQVL